MTAAFDVPGDTAVRLVFRPRTSEGVWLNHLEVADVSYLVTTFVENHGDVDLVDLVIEAPRQPPTSPTDDMLRILWTTNSDQPWLTVAMWQVARDGEWPPDCKRTLGIRRRHKWARSEPTGPNERAAICRRCRFTAWIRRADGDRFLTASEPLCGP